MTPKCNEIDNKNIKNYKVDELRKIKIRHRRTKKLN